MWGIEHGEVLAGLGVCRCECRRAGYSYAAMDGGRPCPSYEAGLDACDPFAQRWCGEARAARVLRRRCRSEGVERSPYDDGYKPLHSGECQSSPRHTGDTGLHTKSHFTVTANRTHDDYVPENGDYLIAHHLNSYYSYNSGKSKPNRINLSPSSVTNATSKLEDRLPKVEELLEKMDYELAEASIPKQPLKSILNNPLPKSAPQGILKKPKTKSILESKSTTEGRRRQRASSESDNLFQTYSSPWPTYESRFPYAPLNVKRAKDNAGTVYSYNASRALSPFSKNMDCHKTQPRCMCKSEDLMQKSESHVKVLRTTAINQVVDSYHKVKLPTTIPEPPSCPKASPALPSPTEVYEIPVSKPVRIDRKKPKKKVIKMKGDSKNMDINPQDDDIETISRSVSPVNTEAWPIHLETMAATIEKVYSQGLCRSMTTIQQAPLMETMSHAPQRIDDNGFVNQLSDKLTNGAVVTPKSTIKEASLTFAEIRMHSLRPSLFPRVPPYLNFVSAEETTPQKLPNSIQKHLKWKLTTITPIVVKKTLVNSGFRLVKSECDTSECPYEETVDWVGIWGKHMKSMMFRSIKDGQKMNHFPGSFQIGRKDRLWRNLQKLSSKHGHKEFGIMPKTYVLPLDMKHLKHDWEKHVANNEKWIIKPPASARGTGIKVISRWAQIPKKKSVVVQRYVSKPYLINGSKFDLRLYVLVTSIHPLRIYLYKDGLARFASVKYNDEISMLHDKYMHLTNYSINRLSKNYTPNEDFAACEGHKWTLQTLFHYLKTEKAINTDKLWDVLKDLVIKTIISGEPSMSHLTQSNVTSRYNCYELFGIDVLLDENLKPWLLEVNISPSLHSASPLDIHVKGPLVTEVLNLAQYQVPVKVNQEVNNKDKLSRMKGITYDSRLYTVYLSKEERDKHIIYTNMEERAMYLRDILSTLTSDDVRHLIQAEDEFTQSSTMERIFPTENTYKYLDFLSGPRYYNRLFDAWETRYAKNRNGGLDLLRNLCDIGYHLEVPSIPFKVDIPRPVQRRHIVRTPSKPDTPELQPQKKISLPSVPSYILKSFGFEMSCGDYRKFLRSKQIENLHFVLRPTANSMLEATYEESFKSQVIL
ncbi:Tubulin polyglutamylase TTLL4 [Eumeta japonica]|uniref:Tubulin polyglutamylase TTLL4 n=1 Tax=Eumeta variegata TaxID=151549 RepID=A0A4C1VXY0_EUMVA|nr:Tubulin polyglutamylase TTLL4 [Eumeta japonica]